ncbi:Golgi apparatus membrane protein tvp23 [Sorochytrium milnesiophthora]
MASIQDRSTLIGNAEPIAGSHQDQNVAIDMPADQVEAQKTMFERSSHPVALFFHLFFRVAAVVMYLVGYYLIQNFILVFVICVLLLAFDFWTVKNITGRLLVGLRWWNEIREDGSNEWVFEARQNNAPNAADSHTFWTSLYVFPLIWAVLAILQLLHPAWLCIAFVALALNGANVIGYTKCDKDAKKRLTGYGQSVMNTGIGRNVMGGILSRSAGATGMVANMFMGNSTAGGGSATR